MNSKILLFGKLGTESLHTENCARMESAPGRSDPSVELPATVNCLLRGSMRFRFPSIELSPEEINIHRNGKSRRPISR